jgi:hypothetical protein
MVSGPVGTYDDDFVLSKTHVFKWGLLETEEG